MVRTYRIHETGEYDLRRIQEETKRSLRSLIFKTPILNGNLIEDIELIQSGSKIINHGLGRQLKGWIIVRLNKNANIWDTAANDRTLTLTTGANNVKISIWVF